MHVERLGLRGFRNLTGPTPGSRLELVLSPRLVVVRGPNAQGKTNLLEALYVCATGKSFRSAPPAELVRHGEPSASLEATFSRSDVRHDVEINVAKGRRHIRIDSRGVRSSRALLELVNVVAFFPDDLRLVKGSPEERRRFLDRAVANHEPAFIDSAVRYQAALKARNALLRQESLDRRLLAVYDNELVQHGALVDAARRRTLEALLPLATEAFAQIMRLGGEAAPPLGLSMSRGLGRFDVEAGDVLESAHRRALEASLVQDRARGVTHVGPHRADVMISLDARPAQRFASQGQQRAIVLGLKLGEVGSVSARLGFAPMLLLDDVSSELDSERTALLFSVILGLDSQVWLSTTGAASLPIPAHSQVLEVRDGGVREAGREA